jgi:hypothetical protein
MKTTNELIELAKAEAKEWTPKLEDAIREGLVDGNVVHLGGKLYAHIHGDQVAMVNDDKETARLSLSDLSDAQRERILVLKGIRAGRASIYRGAVLV